MAITSIDKVGDHIRIVEDGVVSFLTVVGEDTPISVPTDGNRKVVNFYVDEATDKLYAAYHQTGWEEGSPTVLEIAGSGAGSEFDEIRLVPKASSTGAEGTMFYDEDDDHVYVGTA
jgi:hypothetical protein